MRSETRRTYEKRIADLEGLLTKAEDRSHRAYQKFANSERLYTRLLDARRQGEHARKWAIEEAIRSGQADIVRAAVQIADYVYGPDLTADREAETS